MELTLEFGLPQLTLFLLGPGNERFGYLRPETMRSERVLLATAKALMLSRRSPRPRSAGPHARRAASTWRGELGSGRIRKRKWNGASEEVD